MIYLRFENGGIDFGHQNKILTPLDYLLIAVILCVGQEIKDHMKEVASKPFEDVAAYIGEGKIKIRCRCREENKDAFLKILNSCYILDKLSFEREVIFTFKQD